MAWAQNLEMRDWFKVSFLIHKYWS